jgi:hypothetical protein
MTTDLTRCPGRYCGRTLIEGFNLTTACGACPRGYQSNSYLCVPCSGVLSYYDALYLAFTVFLLWIVLSASIWWHWIGAGRLSASERAVLQIQLGIETVVAAVVTTLVFDPMGSMKLYSFAFMIEFPADSILFQLLDAVSDNSQTGTRPFTTPRRDMQTPSTASTKPSFL